MSSLPPTIQRYFHLIPRGLLSQPFREGRMRELQDIADLVVDAIRKGLVNDPDGLRRFESDVSALSAEIMAILASIGRAAAAGQSFGPAPTKH